MIHVTNTLISQNIKTKKLNTLVFIMSLGKLYLVIVKVNLGGQQGLDLPNLVSKVSNFLSGYSNATKVIYKFKVSGEPKIIAVFEVSNIFGLERNLAGLSRIGVFDVTCKPLIPYEIFAASLDVDPSLTHKTSYDPVIKQNELYWLQFDVGQEGLTTDELLKIWKQEAEAALGLKVQNQGLELFKVVGSRQVHVFFACDDPGDIDRMSFNLPLMKLNGANVQLTVQSVMNLDYYTSRIMTEQL
ncbi:hypothetical protein KUTeg_013031 [Tegillarca granosa]|uniref:DUF4279 domain-containing protein n=1 Tax=Tegillarca granosa TaxID=220873 RepID=A0ABQ9EX16_TEGGR|nr:hypothetical protein KUTeg_013031 [Tegillarca granosa]